MSTSEFIGVPIHQDVTAFEEKPFGPLTAKQALYLGLALAVGGITGFVTVYLLGMDMSTASMPIMLFATPIGLLAFVKPDDLSPGKYATLMANHMLNRQQLAFRSQSDPMCKTFHGERPTQNTNEETR